MPRKKALRKTLPKDIEATLEAAATTGDYLAVHQALEACELDARAGFGKYTPLMMRACTPELARWLVARGLDVNAADTWGYTALHGSAFASFHHRLLLELGADVHRTSNEGLTPLHSAADGKNADSARLLLAHGAAVNAASQSHLTPLEYALSRVSNASLTAMVALAEVLLAAGAEVTPRAQNFVKKAAQTFEFHRAAYARESVDAASAACAALCGLFGVPLPKPRQMHDGQAPIVATAATWQNRHNELWELLVPSHGSCPTMQGEVIRITGRIADELSRNGGANWDANYTAMAVAFASHVASHAALSSTQLATCDQAVRSLRRLDGAEATLCELAVAWVTQNPTTPDLHTLSPPELPPGSLLRRRNKHKPSIRSAPTLKS